MVLKIWQASTVNIGDLITKHIFDWLGYKTELSDNPDLIGAGSILNFRFGDLKNCKNINNIKVWGSGLLNEYDIPFTYDKNNYYAVRGLLTKKLIGLDDNITIGDPGILISKFYTPNTSKKYKFGFITHCTDYLFFKKCAGDNFPFPIINVNIEKDTDENIYKFLDQLNECEFIFSSSLHGLIFAHSYGIPCVYLENKLNPCRTMDNVISQNNFKFKDYYSGLDIDFNIEYFNGTFDFMTKYENINYNKFKISENSLIEMQNNLVDAAKKLKNDLEKSYYSLSRLPELDENDKKAWLCFISSDNYMYYALNLYKCLIDVKSKYPFYCGVTKNISTQVIDILQTVGIKIIYLDTDDIEKSGIIQRSAELGMCQKYLNALTKLALFKNDNLFDKVVYLDCDLHVFENIDELMNKDHMSAVEDLAPWKYHKAYTTGCSIFCSGLFVWDFKNNHNLMSRIIAELKQLPNIGQWHDQNILNYYYPYWKDNIELHLSPTYGLMNHSGAIKIFKRQPKIMHYVQDGKQYMPFNKKIRLNFDSIVAIKSFEYYKNIAESIYYFNNLYALDIESVHLDNIIIDNYSDNYFDIFEQLLSSDQNTAGTNSNEQEENKLKKISYLDLFW